MADQVLSRTLNQKFDTVFEEVTHQETLNLLNILRQISLITIRLWNFWKIIWGCMCFRELNWMSWWMPEKTERSHLRQ